MMHQPCSGAHTVIPGYPYFHGAHTAPNLNIVCWSQVWVTTKDKKKKKKKKIMGWHSMPVLLPYCALLAALALLCTTNPALGQIQEVALSADGRLVMSTGSTLQPNEGGNAGNSSQQQQSSKSPNAKPMKSQNKKSKNKKKEAESGQGAKGSGAPAPEPFSGRLVATSGHHAASFSLYLGVAVQAQAHATSSMHCW